MTAKHATSRAAFQRASLVSVELRNEGYVAIRCSTEVLNRMCAGQGAIVTNGKCLPPFSRARIYKLLRYPSVKDVRCLPRPLHFLLASPRIHIPLGLSWLSFLAADRLNRSPPLSTAERPVAWPIPPHASCVVRTRMSPSPHPTDGITSRQAFQILNCSICSRTLVTISPALFRHGLPSKITLKKVFPSRPDSGTAPRYQKLEN